MTDIAELVGFSRQNMRKLYLHHSTDFPPPVHGGNPAIWHLAKVLVWLKQRKTYKIDDRLLDVAQTTMQFNLIRETRELKQRVHRELRELVA